MLIDGMQTMAAGMVAARGLFYCTLPVFVKFPAVYVYALAYLARVWRIWFKYRYSSEKQRAEQRRVERMNAEETLSSRTPVLASAYAGDIEDGGEKVSDLKEVELSTALPGVVNAATSTESSPPTVLETPSRENTSNSLTERGIKDSGVIEDIDRMDSVAEVPQRSDHHERSDGVSKNLQTMASPKCIHRRGASSGDIGGVDSDIISRWFYEKRRFFGEKSLQRIVVGLALALWVLPVALFFAGGSTFADQETPEMSCDEQNPWPTFATFAITGMRVTAGSVSKAPFHD